MTPSLRWIPVRAAVAEVPGFSLVTNQAAGLAGAPLDHAEELAASWAPSDAWAGWSPR